MPKNLHRILPTIVLLGPLLLALLATILGTPVNGRDDLNYINELQTRPFLAASPDQLSWIVLKLVIGVAIDPVMALRLSGFLICLGTCSLLLSKRAGDRTILYFLISISSLYWTLYFNQLRLGLAVGLFFLMLIRGRQLLAPFIGGLAHSSMLLLIFPPAIILAPFTLSVVELFDPSSFAAVRFAAYRDAEYLLMPWYFGWELVGLALVLAFEQKPARAFGVVVYAIAVRMLADRVSVEIARRLLELGLFAYSPVISYLRTRVEPMQSILGFYALLGMLSLYAAIAGGVVSIGGM